MYLTSQGSPNRLGLAKEIAIGSIIGLILGLTSYLILILLNPRLTICKEELLENFANVNIENWEDIEWESSLVETNFSGDPCKDQTLYDSCEEANCPEGKSCVAGAQESKGKFCCTSCGQGLVALASAHIGTCYGPCHCAWFVSNILVESGCPTSIRSNSAEGLEAKLQSYGFQQTSSPGVDDIGFVTRHTGIYAGGKSIHAAALNDSGYTRGKQTCNCGSGSKCAGTGENKRCAKSSSYCPGCEGRPNDPRGPFVDSAQRPCKSNQCISLTPYHWKRYYTRPK